MSSQSVKVVSPLFAVPSVVGTVVVEIIKYVLHIKQQMPMIYESLLRETKNRKAQHFTKQFDIMANALKEFITSSNPATIIISLGPTLNNPKEMYPIYLPQHSHLDSEISEKQVASLIRGVIRECVANNFPNLDTTIGPTKINIMVQQRSSSTLSPTPSPWPSTILPKQSYLPPFSPKRSPTSLFLSPPSPLPSLPSLLHSLLSSLTPPTPSPGDPGWIEVDQRRVQEDTKQTRKEDVRIGGEDKGIGKEDKLMMEGTCTVGEDQRREGKDKRADKKIGRDKQMGDRVIEEDVPSDASQEKNNERAGDAREGKKERKRGVGEWDGEGGMGDKDDGRDEKRERTGEDEQSGREGEWGTVAGGLSGWK
eukprot:Phypoly_transcript_10876.p1 GENE.Phypoly_transcript_10876~~Phypoly_transcript_10876.p1  ORF type:complete len:366 (+),score=93.10 Phypoly_transcript_10876:136-1233(+)